MTERRAPSRYLYIIPLLFLTAAGWFAFARDLGLANAAEPKTNQNDARRFKAVGGLVEDTATGIRRPLVAGRSLADAFPESDFANIGDLRLGRGPRPLRLSVGSIALASDVMPIGIDENRAIAVPERADIVGWWSGGAVPGENGPTVLVGHYDSKVAPGVFENLRKLGPGSRIVVEQSDGSVFLYDVTLVEQFSKTEFPTDAVYGPTKTSTLRLVTCGGEFDNETRHYADNTVVYANLVAPPGPELRADRPITVDSESPPVYVAPDPSLIGVDGGAGMRVSSTTSTAVPTTATSIATTTTTLPVVSTSVAPPTLPAVVNVPPTVSVTQTPPTTLLTPPVSGPSPVASSSPVPSSTPVTTTPAGTNIPIEPGAPVATSVSPALPVAPSSSLSG